jgi:hypothetical protein
MGDGSVDQPDNYETGPASHLAAGVVITRCSVRTGKRSAGGTVVATVVGADIARLSPTAVMMER